MRENPDLDQLKRQVTKLHEAAESGDLETARLLLNRRPEIVDLAQGEMRALHMAVLRRDLDMTAPDSSTTRSSGTFWNGCALTLSREVL